MLVFVLTTIASCILSQPALSALEQKPSLLSEQESEKVEAETGQANSSPPLRAPHSLLRPRRVGTAAARVVGGRGSREGN